MKENLTTLFYRPIKYFIGILFAGLIISFIVIPTMIFTTNYPNKQIDYIYGRNNENYLQIEGEFSNNDVKKLKDELNIDVINIHDIYDDRLQFDITNYVPLPIDFYGEYSTNFNYFKKTITYEKDNSFFSSMNLKFGSWPKNDGEVVISDYYFKYFENLGYVYNNDHTNPPNDNEKEAISSKKIKANPKIILGKKIEFFNQIPGTQNYYNLTLKITGVLDTGFFETDENAIKDNFIAKSGLFGSFILNENDFSKIYQANKDLPIDINEDKIYSSVFLNVGKDYDKYKKSINLLSSLDVGKMVISHGLNSRYIFESKNRVILNRDLRIIYNKPDRYNYNSDIEIIGYTYGTDTYVTPYTFKYNREVTTIDSNYALPKFKNTGIILASILIIPLIIYLAIIIPYFRDCIYEKGEFYKDSIIQKNIKKTILLQYLFTWIFTFLASVLFIFTICIPMNLSLVDSSWFSASNFVIYSDNYHWYNALNPLNLTILYLLFTLLLSAIISLIPFLCNIKNLKEFKNDLKND